MQKYEKNSCKLTQRLFFLGDRNMKEKSYLCICNFRKHQHIKIRPMKKKFICPICGYVHEGEEAPERCPQCKQIVEWKVVDESAALNFVTEHVLGIAKGTGDDMIKDLNAHYMGEATEVGMYLAMSRQADREGYPEIAEAFKRYAFEEAEHCARFAELLGDVVWDTKTNVYKRMIAECGACEDKMRIARVAKERNLDAIHDTVHEMAKDEARHGKGFEGLYKRYFGE